MVSSADIDDKFNRAAKDAYAFRLVMPWNSPPTTRTFFGGRPTLGSGHQWPVARLPGAGARRPMTVLGQVNLTDLPLTGSRPLLPKKGMLHFFEYTDDRDNLRGHVIYSKDAAAAATPLPASAPPYGHPYAEQRHAWRRKPHDRAVVGGKGVDGGGSLPTSYPRWAVSALRVRTLPPASTLCPIPSDKASAEAFRPFLARYLALTDKNYTTAFGSLPPDPELRGWDAPLWRPYDGFPAAWIFVEVWASVYLNYQQESRNPFRIDEAQIWLTRAQSNGSLTAVSRSEADEFWSWVCATANDWVQDVIARPPPPGMTRWGTPSLSGFNAATEFSIHVGCDFCLSNGLSAAILVKNYVELSLARRYSVSGWVKERVLHQMLGLPPVCGSIGEEVLLMQFRTDRVIGYSFGDGDELQFWIKHDDLIAQRFDLVRTCITH